MQILSISDIYAPQENEVATSLRTLLREMQAKGHAVTLIAPEYPAARDEPSEDVLRVSAHALPFGAPGSRAMKMHRVLELTERLRGWNYDIIHVHTPFVAHFMGVALARRLGLPIVETWYTFYEEAFARYAPLMRTGWLRALAGAISRLQCHSLDGIIVPSTGMQDRLAQYGVQRPITVVPTAIDVQLFQQGDGVQFRETYGIAPERPTLLYVGALNETSELEFLFAVVQAIRAQIPDVSFVVAGGGPAEPYLREQVRRKDLDAHVIFVGRLDRAHRLLDAYQAADCLVLAPNSDTHSVPLLEALASGLPVVTTSSIGRRDILSEEGGALVADDNVPHFSSQVLRLLREAALRERLAVSARAHIQEWSASLAAEQVLDCYRQVLAARMSPARVLAR